MNQLARIAMLCEGDAESPDQAFSGTANSILLELRRLGHTVETVDSELYGARRFIAAARALSPNRRTWGTRFHLGASAFLARTAQAQRGYRRLQEEVDLIFQFGATFQPPDAGIRPYVLYCDWNMALAVQEKATGQSPALHISQREAQEILAREQAIYQGAATIFTISERLRQAFIEQIRIAADRVVTVYAGPNLDLTRVPPRSSRHEARKPTILFVGRDFRRKGGDVLLAAFREVRRDVPTARLLIVGPDALAISEPGVEVLGFLRRAVPDEWRRLIEAYLSSDVFCLPTRYEPFGIAVVEAMFFELPCVASDIWAIPEMIVDGETGFTVPRDDASALAARLKWLLKNPKLARSMGQAGLRRAQERFTWSAAADKMHDRIQSILAHR